MARKPKQRLYKPFAANLRALWRQFKRCSEIYLPLYHDRLMAWSSDGPETITNGQWDAFIAANSQPEGDDGNDWMWHSGVDGIGRFWGCLDGLSEFQQLAKSVCIVIREMEIETHGIEHDAWLDILHDVAFRQYLPLLRSDMTLWGWEQPLGDEFYELVDQWQVSAEGKREYPLHPCKWSLAHSVFISSMTMIEAILDPDSVMLTSSALDRDYVSEVLQYVTRSKSSGDDEGHDYEDSPAPHSPEHDYSAKKNLFRRTGTKGPWHLRYSEEGEKPEEQHFEHEEGFVIYQQLLSSKGLPVPNRDLRDHSKRAVVRGGDSVVPEQDMTGEIHADDDGDAMEMRWSAGESKQEVSSPEAIAWMKAEWKSLEEQLEEAVSSEDSARTSDLKTQQRKLRKLLNESITDTGKPKTFSAGGRTERDRIRVAKALSECRKTLEPQMPRLHAFLKKYVKPREGIAMQYLKAEEVTWDT